MDDIRGARKIAVLRPGAVGDFAMTLPALHALRHAYPEAEIVYVGKEWHAAFLAGRPGPIDRVAVMPACEGVGAVAGRPDIDSAAVERFLDAMRAERFDIALQLHGGGRYSNPFIKRFRAAVTAGMRAPDAEALDRWVPYGRLQNRRLHMLTAAATVGAGLLLFGRELEVTERDREEAADIVRSFAGKRFVVIQPGSTDPRRCWPPGHFAALADRLAGAGLAVAINGTMQEAPLVHDIIERMRHRAHDLSGRLSLRGLCGLLERASLAVSNDTGPLHLALAVGTPSVGIYWLTNLIESGPLRQDIHAAAMSVRTRCIVCGEENVDARCLHDASFVGDVTVDEVWALAEAMLVRFG